MLLLIRSRQVEFESDFDLEASLARLVSATDPARFHRGRRQAAVGSVDADRVTLSRGWPHLRFWFKPFFNGRFEARNGRVVLSGAFRMRGEARAALWYAFAVLAVLGAGVVWAAPDPADAAPVLRQLSLALAVFIAFVAGVTLVGAADMSFVSRCIRRALRAESAGGG